MWLEALHRDTEIGGPLPIVSRDGRYLVSASAEGVPGPRLCMVETWLPGVMLVRKRLTESVLEANGQLFARLHEHGAGFGPPDGFTKRRMDRIFSRGEDDLLVKGTLRSALDDRSLGLFIQSRKTVQDAFARLWTSSYNPQLIHNDLWYENIKVYRGRVFPYDFEDTVWGYPVQDLATALLDLIIDVDPDR